MRGSLGEKIGEGALSDVHAWAPSQVVKLYKPGVSRQLGWHEVRMTRAVFAAGCPAPEVLDVVTLEGRFGIVLARLDGPTLLQLTKSGAMSFAQAGAILASLYRAVHQTPSPRDVITLRVWMDHALPSVGDLVPPRIAKAIVALIERLQRADALCHGDLHPDNVIITAAGPRIIDWSLTMRAPPAFDLAQCHVLLTELAATRADNPERPLSVDAATQAEYARLAGLSRAALTAAMEPYLPIVRVFILMGGPPSPLRERLIERIDAALSAQS